MGAGPGPEAGFTFFTFVLLSGAKVETDTWVLFLCTSYHTMDWLQFNPTSNCVAS